MRRLARSVAPHGASGTFSAAGPAAGCPWHPQGPRNCRQANGLRTEKTASSVIGPGFNPRRLHHNAKSRTCILRNEVRTLVHMGLAFAAGPFLFARYPFHRHVRSVMEMAKTIEQQIAELDARRAELKRRQRERDKRERARADAALLPCGQGFLRRWHYRRRSPLEVREARTARQTSEAGRRQAEVCGFRKRRCGCDEGSRVFEHGGEVGHAAEPPSGEAARTQREGEDRADLCTRAKRVSKVV